MIQIPTSIPTAFSPDDELLAALIASGVLSGDSGAVLDPDAAAYIALVETADGEPLEPAVKVAMNNVFVRAKDEGVWDDAMQLTIAAGPRSLDGALEPLAGSALTNTNFVSGDYNRVDGFIGGAGKYLTGVPGNTFGQDDFLAASYITRAIPDANTETCRFFGNGTTAGCVSNAQTVGSKNFASRGKSTNASSYGMTTTGKTGYISIGRAASTEFEWFVVADEGVVTADSTGNSAAAIQFFNYSGVATSAAQTAFALSVFHYGPYADGAVWKSILDEYHAAIAAALS